MNIDRRALRWSVLLSALAAAGWLALFGNRPLGGVDSGSIGVVQPSARATSPSPRTAGGAAAPAPIERLRPRAELAREGTRRVPDLFAPAPWTLPAATRGAATLPAAPRVEGPEPPPPLPYRYTGKKLEGGRWEVYLTRDDSNTIAREGATLDAAYRVDRIEPPTLWLTHLPSGRPQSLAIGDMP